MSYEAGLFPAARQIFWPCAPQPDRRASLTGVPSVCYFQVPAEPTLAYGRSVVIQTWPTGAGRG